MVAGVHGVGQGVGMSQPAADFLHVPRLDQLADMGGADDLAVQHDGRDHVAAESVLRAVFPQALHRALAPVTEAEVVPDDDVADGELLHDALDELPPGDVHGVLGKMQEHDVFDAELAADQVLPANGAVDERHVLVEYQRIRVHVEAQHRGHGAECGRALLRPAKKRRVPDMHPVKKAKGDDPSDLCHVCLVPCDFRAAARAAPGDLVTADAFRRHPERSEAQSKDCRRFFVAPGSPE